MGAPLRVLLVEDSEPDAELLLRELRHRGYEVSFRRVDTADAMSAALERGSWDVVLSDHSMPHFSAAEALALLRASGLDLPFIVVSGAIGEETAVALMKAGAHDYVMKGNLARLAAVVAREIGEAEMRRGRREAEEALRRAKDELEAKVAERTADLTNANERLVSSMMEAKEAAEAEKALRHELQEYISLISHDLRNPLTGIIGMAQWLRGALEKKGLAREAASVEPIVKSAHRMNTMIQDLVDSARLEAGQAELHKEPIDLLNLISDLLDRLGTPEVRARIQIEASDWVPPVLADPKGVDRALANLLTNALKYSPPEAPVCVRLLRCDCEAVVEVSDQGVGIPADDLPRLFSRFFRASTATAHEGLGLGLYITRLIAESHGGRVAVDSAVGQGSTFSLVLPLMNAPG